MCKVKKLYKIWNESAAKVQITITNNLCITNYIKNTSIVLKP